MKTAIAKLSNRVEQVEKGGGGTTSESINLKYGKQFEVGNTAVLYIPLCLSSSKYFTCKIFIDFSGVDNICCDIFYSNTVLQLANLVVYKRQSMSFESKEFKLVKITQDGEDIICLKINENDGGYTLYYDIVSQQEITSIDSIDSSNSSTEEEICPEFNIHQLSQ